MMSLLFLVPLAAMVAFSLLYFNDLGFKAVGVYWLIWLAGVGVTLGMVLPFLVISVLQVVLAVSMWFYVKKVEFGI